MALTNAFFDAVNNENVRRIRIMMKDSLLVDPTFKEFKEMEAAAEKVSGLYDIHDGREFVTDESAWDDNYMDKQMVQLVGNFSHERIEHLKDVIRVLRPVKRTAGATNSNSAKTQTSSGSHSYEEQKRFDQQNGTYKGAVIAGGAVAGAVVGGVIVAAAGGAVAVGAVAGAVVGGAAASAVVVLGGKK